MNPTLKAALAYAAQGLAIFPAPPDVKKSHKSAAHSNGSRWGATRNPAEITADFRRWPNARIGLPTGAINGLVIIETDTVEGHGVDGAASLAKLEFEHGRLPDTLAAISPSGSVHSYLRHPGAGLKIKTTGSELGPGIDVRGDGGMVLVPPSVNTDGLAYRWLNRLPIAPMPDWLVELTREKQPTISQRAVDAIRRPVNGSTCTTASGDAYGRRALEYELAELVITPKGRRNAALNRASFSLHQLVAGGELNGGEVLRQLVVAATINGLVGDDGLPSVLATIESGQRAGLQHPRSRPAR
jgi:putative DNA primase/helicase